jgi:V/A-type H+/Na+-transporting ATPase subunit E
MTLENIRKAVLTKAEVEANHIMENARGKTSVAMDAQKERIKRDSDRHYNVSIQAIEDDYRRKFLQYKGVGGKQILEKRNRLIDSIFEKAEETILNYSDEEYGDFMTRLINNVAGSVGGRLYIHPDDKGIFSKILMDINEKRSSEKKIVPDETHPLNNRGGFVFAGTNFEVDQTLKTMLKDIEQEMLPMIARELFSILKV